MSVKIDPHAPWEFPPIGYEALLRQYELDALPHHVRSFIGTAYRERIEANGQARVEYPVSYSPRHANELIGHLEFALKYEGISLGILSALFERTGEHEIETYVRERPTGKYARKLWFLYEWLTGRDLDLPDAGKVASVDVLDPEIYVTADSRKSKRHRVTDNLLGTPEFCPIIRRQPLAGFADLDIPGEARRILDRFDASVIARAEDYLYMKETKASFAIERERPDQRRAARFVELLRSSHMFDEITKARLVEIQNVIVDERFRDHDYRTSQVYVGESLGMRERIHYVCPKPNDVDSLMRGLLEVLKRTTVGEVDPVVSAAAIAFGFVYIHPFSDANGRLHRFLIHHILSNRDFTPEGAVIPVSATILHRRRSYDECLERLSRPIAQLVSYDIDQEGLMDVHGETARFYRYLDLTAAAAFLYTTLEQTVRKDFLEELEFLKRYDEAKVQLLRIVDLPDRMLNLFVKLTVENRGELNEGKRKRLFSMLTEDEVSRMKQVVKSAFLDHASEPPIER